MRRLDCRSRKGLWGRRRAAAKFRARYPAANLLLAWVFGVSGSTRIDGGFGFRALAAWPHRGFKKVCGRGWSSQDLTTQLRKKWAGGRLLTLLESVLSAPELPQN